MSAPEPGTMIAGKYRVERVLGAGGMGVVVAAHHVQLDQQIAIKFLLPEALKHQEIVERFAREARAAAKIRGEHVARVIDVGQFDNGTPFMVMEYLEGHDLAKQLETSGPLLFEDAVRYILEACEALAEAHAAKIVHRDLKPSNLFLATQPDKRSIIKVLDFGISKIGDTSSAALTQTSALIGTAYYMSPEQLMAPKTVDHRSDIWSLGVILYELLGGRPPFTGESVPEIIAGILQNSPAPLRTLRPDIPAALEEVIATCMRPRDARYATVAKLARALGPFAAQTDRLSIEVTSRVLNESLAPPGPTTGPVQPPGATVVLTPNPASARNPMVPGAVTTGSAVVTPASTSQAGQTVPAAALTAQGLSTSAIIPGVSRKPAVPLVGVIAGVAVLAGLVGGGIVMSRGNGGAKPAAAGLVAAPPETSTAPPAVPSAAPAPPPTSTLLPLATATEPPTETASPATPRPTAAAHAPATGAGRPAAPARAAATAVASAAKSAAPPPPAPTAPATAAAPTATSKSNPLNMGIK